MLGSGGEVEIAQSKLLGIYSLVVAQTAQWQPRVDEKLRYGVWEVMDATDEQVQRSGCRVKSIGC